MRDGGSGSGISSNLKKLQRERDNVREDFENREREYVKRLETAGTEISEIKKELHELRTKVLKMEMNEQSLTEEVRNFPF